MGDEAEVVSEEAETGAEEESPAGWVAGGIFLSRIFGLLRERAVAYFFGVGAHADVLQVAFKSPTCCRTCWGRARSRRRSFPSTAA